MEAADRTLARQQGSSHRRVRERIRNLIRHFDDYCDTFNQHTPFSGPSSYFHLKTLCLLGGKSVTEVLNDQQFLDSLYATLASWGLHRMGPRGAKLVEFDDMVKSFRAHAHDIEKLSRRRIWELQESEVREVAEQIWRVIDGIAVSSTKTQIVAGSKALHHVLPRLVPPIDRQYTIRFFYGYGKDVGKESGGRAFLAIYQGFWEISRACCHLVEKRLERSKNRSPTDTSFTKVIDNAIVGYGLERSKGSKKSGKFRPRSSPI